MRTSIKGAFALAFAVALSGCTGVVAGINDVTGALSSPQATLAAANVKAFSVGFVCGIGSLTGLAASVEQTLQTQLKNGNALVTADTQIVYVVSSSICGALGGKVASNAVAVPATAQSALP